MFLIILSIVAFGGSLRRHVGFPGGAVVKNPPASAGNEGWEDPLEDKMAIHSSILAWEIPGGLWPM